MLMGWRYDRTDWMLVLVFGLLTHWSSVALAHEASIEADTEIKAGSADATKAYVKAADAQNSRQFAEAAERWDAFVNDFAGDPLVTRAQHYLGVCRLQANDLAGAEIAFSKSLKGPVVAGQSAFREETLIDLGWVHFLRGAEGDTTQMQQSGEFFGKYLKEYPQGKWMDEALFYRGEALVFAGDAKAGIELHRRVVEEFPDSPLRVESLFAVGAGLYDLGQGADATKYFDEFIEKHHDDDLLADVAFRRGQLFIDEKKFKSAAHMFGVAASDTDFAARDQALFQRGYCLSASRNYIAAANAYAAVVRNFPDSRLSEQAVLDTGRCFFHASEMEKASEWLNRALELKDTDRMLQARHWLSRVGLVRKQFESASQESLRGLDWIKENAEGTHRMHLPLLLDYAEALEGVPGKQPEALDSFLTLVDRYPKTNVAPRALYRAVRLSVTLKDTERANSLSDRFDKEYGDHTLASEVKKIKAEFALSRGETAAAESQLRELMAEKESAAESNEQTELPTPPQSSTTPTLPAGDANGTDDEDGAAPAAPSLGDPAAKLDSNDNEIDAIDPQASTTAVPNKDWPLPVRPTLTGEANGIESKLRIALKLGHALFLQEKYDECIYELQPAVNTAGHGPEHSEVLQLIGTSQFYLGQYDLAVQSLSKAVMKDPHGKNAPQACIRLAQSLAETDRLNDAKTVLSRVVKDFPLSEMREQCVYQLAELEYSTNNDEAASQRYKQLLSEYPESKYANASAFGVAQVAVRKGDTDQAVKLFARLLDQGIEQDLERRVRVLYASTAQMQGDHAVCLDNLEFLLEGGIAGDDRSDTLLMAAPSHIAQEHRGLARQCLESILTDNPKYPRTDQVLYQLAWLAKREGDTATAARRFATLVATRGNSPLAAEANFHLGEVSFHQDRVKEALPYYAAAAKSATNNELAEKSVHRLAWCYFRNRAYSEAHSVLILQLKKFPQGRTAQVAKFLTAECLFMQSDFAAALPHYAAVADGDGLSAKQEALVYLHGGQAAGKQGRWQEAERWLIQIHMKFKDTEFAPMGYWELSQVLKAQERHDESVMAMRQAAKAGKGETSAQAQFELAKLARSRGGIGLAYREFQVLMYGYGGKLAPPAIKKWQVLAALQAADCAAENAKQAFRSEEEKYVRQAEKCLTFVIEESPGTDAAQTASRRLATLVDQFDVEPMQR